MNYSQFRLDLSTHAATECPQEKSVLVFSRLPLDLVIHFAWKYGCLSSKPENKQLAASITSHSQELCFLRGILAIDAEIVLGGVPCQSSPESLHFFSLLWAAVPSLQLFSQNVISSLICFPFSSRLSLFFFPFVFHNLFCICICRCSRLFSSRRASHLSITLSVPADKHLPTDEEQRARERGWQAFSSCGL